MRRTAAAAACLVLAACGGGSIENNQGPEWKLSVVSGSARVTTPAGPAPGARSYEIGEGDEIEVSGLAELNLGPGRRVELMDAGIKVVSASRLRLRKGKLLAQVGRPFFADAENVSVAARSAVFRIDKELSSRVGVYRGGVRAGAPGEFLRVPRFRQIIVAGDVIPRAADPLEFAAADVWDARLLAAAIDLDARLSNFSRGLEAQLGQGAGLEFFARLTSAAQVDFLAPYLDRRRSDVLIGLVTALESLNSLPGDLKRRFAAVFELSTRGATWGLIALEFRVPAENLFASLTKAVERSGIQVIGPGPGLLRRPPPGPAGGPRVPPPARGGGPAAPPRPPAPPAPGRTPLLPGVGEAAPELKMIIDDLLGVVDPQGTLPGLL